MGCDVSKKHCFLARFANREPVLVQSCLCLIFADDSNTLGYKFSGKQTMSLIGIRTEIVMIPICSWESVFILDEESCRFFVGLSND